MKKKYIIYLSLAFSLIVSFLIVNKNSYAQDQYQSFAYINVDSGKLLRNYTDKEIDEKLSEVRHKKFMGWNIYLLNDHVNATFIKESLFCYKNEGSTPIKYNTKVKSEKTVKTSVSVKGSIATDVKGTIKTFKGGLTEELQIQGDFSEIDYCQEEENLEIVVDPYTMVVGSIEGSGIYTNGVAVSYLCFIEKQIGAFEYFQITNSYLRIEKIKL